MMRHQQSISRLVCAISSTRSTQVRALIPLMDRSEYLAQKRSLSSSSLSRRDIAALEEDLTAAVGQLKDPVLDRDLKSLGWLSKRLAIKDDEVTLTLQLPSLLHPELDELKARVTAAANTLMADKGLQLKASIHVQPSKPFPVHTSTTDQHNEYLKTLGPGLANVSHCLAVYSCKGGVGKSTLAVNIAYELARQGGRVGLLDVDIYGPSLPILVQPDDPTVRQSSLGPGMVLPIEHGGVKLLSLGFVSPESGVPGSGDAGGAAVMRGPMAGRVVTQLLKGTEWGELDVLVLDLPPGTGDVQLAICQDLRLTGALAVTTPSKLALADAKKGIEMFTSLGVPTLAVVENMAYFVCEGGGRHYPFGKGQLLQDEIKNTFQLPISTITNDANDSGSPLSLERPVAAVEELAVMERIATELSREMLLSQHGQSDVSADNSQPHKVLFPNSSTEDVFDVASTHLTVNEEGFLARFFSDKGAMQIPIPAENLRVRHPKTGEILEEESGMVQKSRRLLPAKLDPKGRYGYSVKWADGATIIYSMLSIAKAGGATPASPPSE